MKGIKKVLYMIAFAIVTIVKLPIDLFSTLLNWIVMIHIRMLVELIKWHNDPTDIAIANRMLDNNASALKDLGEKWYLAMKIES